MIRCAFNGGELSPQAAVRADMDVYHRGASCLQNVDVGQMGGVSRRRGFKWVVDALEDSVILPYVYSTTDRFLVEVSPVMVRVIDVDGGIVAALTSVWSADEVSVLRYKQVNSLLFLACSTHELMVLQRDDEGDWSLGAYEFKNYPWRDEEFRDYPVRLTLDDGCYRVSFGDFAGDADAAVVDGDVMRVEVTVSSQTGFMTANEIYAGYVIEGDLSKNSSYQAGDKLCINEGSYWAWWTCEKNFKGSDDFVVGLTSVSDYPEFFSKGIACHANTITCKGTWAFYCYKEWYGSYAVERRYQNEQDWTLLGTSTSKVGAASNLQLTGDESGEECYLRLMLYESQVSDKDDPSKGFPDDECGNKLVVDAYKKDVVLRLRSSGRPDTVQSFVVESTPQMSHFLSTTRPSVSASRVWVDDVEIAGATAELTLGADGVHVKPKGLLSDVLSDGQRVRFGWKESAKKAEKVSLDSRGMRTDWWPAGAKFTVHTVIFAHRAENAGAVVELEEWSSTKVKYSTVWWDDDGSYTAPSSGFYTIRILPSNNAGSTVEAAECEAVFEGVASSVVKPVVDGVSTQGLNTSDVLSFAMGIDWVTSAYCSYEGVPDVSGLVIDGQRFSGDGIIVSRSDRTMVVKPSGVTSDDVVVGSVVRLEWWQEAESIDQQGNGNKGSIYLGRFLTAGTVVRLQGWRSVASGVEITMESTISTMVDGRYKAVFSAMEEDEYVVEADGLYTICVHAWTESNVKLRSHVVVEVPECTAWLEGEVSEVVASAEYSLWDNISTIKDNIPASGDYLKWSFAAFRGVYGHPSLVDVFQQRLVLGGTVAQPQTVWMSKSDDLNNFEVGTDDDSALALTLATTTNDKMCWLMSHGDKLLVGTADSEWVIGATSGALTASNAQAMNHGFVGSSDVCALMALDRVLYLERGGGRVYMYGYDYESDHYASHDLTVFNDVVLSDGGGGIDVAFIRKPEPRAVFVRQDGQLAIMTYNSSHNVHAWHRYVTDGRIERVAVLPNGNDSDLLFLIVSRDEGRFIEVMGPSNDYLDHGGRDYESVVVTNALCVMDNAGHKAHRGPLLFYLGADSGVDGIRVSADGQRWDRLDVAPSATLTEGWHPLVADGYWDWDSVCGIKVCGNRGFCLLAIQG